MKNFNKNNIIIAISVLVTSACFWSIYFNNIYNWINIFRDMFSFQLFSYKIIIPILTTLMLLIYMVVILKSLKKNLFLWLLFIALTNILLLQYPLYFKINNNTKLDTELYYKMSKRFENKEEILDINSYKKNKEEYILTINIFKTKNNLILLEELLQSVYINKEIRYYENFGNDIDMERIYTLSSLKSEFDLSIKFQECENIKNNEIFYFCTKYNIPSKIKYKIYLNNLNFTGINSQQLWNSNSYKSFVLNNFVHYNEAISEIDINSMTTEEKNKDIEYRNKIRSLLRNYKLEDIFLMKVVENNIILKNRYASQGEIFKNPEMKLTIKNTE